MQQIEPLVVCEQRIGTMLKEEVHDVVVAPFRSPQYRSCNGITTFRVHVGAVLEEEVAESIVVVNGGPLFEECQRNLQLGATGI